MFCKNCGKQIEDDAAFCPGCGTNVNSQPQPNVQTPPPVYQQPIAQQPVQQASSKPATKKGKIIGIVLLVFGIMSIIGMATNGTFARFATEGITIANCVSILIEAGFIIGGIYLINKNKNQ